MKIDLQYDCDSDDGHDDNHHHDGHDSQWYDCDDDYDYDRHDSKMSLTLLSIYSIDCT